MSAPPFDAETEEAVIGACLYHRRHLEVAFLQLVPSTFYVPRWSATWQALSELFAEGAAVTTLTVRDRLRSMGRAEPTEAELATARDDSPSSIDTYIEILLRLKASRDCMFIGQSTAQAMSDPAVDPWAVIDTAIIDLEKVLRGRGVSARSHLDGVLDTSPDEAPWVIEDLLRQDERIVFVGPEGKGKSTLLRQWAMCVGQGVHPLTHKLTAPHRVLIVDAENSLAVIQETGITIRYAVKRALLGGGNYDPERVQFLRKPQGLELRTHRGQMELRAALEAFHPEVVFAGPLYQLGSKKSGERDDDYAADMQGIFNRLRVRYHFALVLEDHAPQSQDGHRAMRPFGSSLWLRWPEFGIGLVTGKEGSLVVDTFRGHRSGNRAWPSEFVRTSSWPWEARFPPARSARPTRSAMPKNRRSKRPEPLGWFERLPRGGWLWHVVDEDASAPDGTDGFDGLVVALAPPEVEDQLALFPAETPHAGGELYVDRRRPVVDTAPL